MSDDKKPQEQVEDQELSDLLDNALEDFNREPKFKSKTKDEPNKSEKSEKPETLETPEIPSSSEDVLSAMLGDDKWTQDFIKQAADQFENLMQNGTEDLGALHKAAQAVVSAMVDGENPQPDDMNADFRSAISQALKNLSATSETLQNSSTDFNEAELASMLDQASLGEGAGEVLPFIKGMMQSLLSKEILHPALKELVDKYPEWLEEHKATLTSADVQRYTKQLGLMQKACMELEKEKDEDSEDVKKNRFEVIFSLMQEMQACGLPPQELTGEQLNLFQ